MRTGLRAAFFVTLRLALEMTERFALEAVFFDFFAVRGRVAFFLGLVFTGAILHL